jgi:hypothetical protein
MTELRLRRMPNDRNGSRAPGVGGSSARRFISETHGRWMRGLHPKLRDRHANQDWVISSYDNHAVSWLRLTGLRGAKFPTRRDALHELALALETLSLE